MSIYGRALLSVLTDGWASGKTTDHSHEDVLASCFDVALALYWLDPNAVPAEWGFRAAPSGGLDYAECDTDGTAECVTHPSGECNTVHYLLWEAGITDFANPYGSNVAGGFTAEAALVCAGTIVSRYESLIRDRNSY